MVYIILSILGIVGILIVKSIWSYQKQIFLILMTIITGFIVFLGLYFMLHKLGVIEKGGPSFFTQIPWSDIGLYFSMIAGMVAKYIYDWIGDGNEPKKKFSKWQLLKPMLVSPIVFIAVFNNTAQNTSMVLLLIFAFQNGFFWQIIFTK